MSTLANLEQWNGGSDRFAAGLIRYFTNAGHRIVWLTTMIDQHWRNQQFSHYVEIREISTPLSLHPGDWFTQNVLLGYYLSLTSLRPDLIVCDHSASCLPMLKWRYPSTKILFYCHFPQQLVTPSRFFVYRWYSAVIALIEEILFTHADIIMVNSQFTADQFVRVMPSTPIDKLRVVYPPCDEDAIRSSIQPAISRLRRIPNVQYTFLSMNRFWPEKRIDVIVEAAALLKQRGYRPLIKLAGSVMPHIPESRIYFDQLQSMAANANILGDLIEFVASPDDVLKFRLFVECDTVIYTPPNEHFGIVPIEALEQRRPVIVCDSGGPAETVIQNVTGTKISAPTAELLADAMIAHMHTATWPELDDDDIYRNGQHRRFIELFSSIGFASAMNDALTTIFETKSLSLINNYRQKG